MNIKNTNTDIYNPEITPSGLTYSWIDETIENIVKKMSFVSERSKYKIPAKTINGIHDDRSDGNPNWRLDDGLNWWTNGFWGGMMWLMYDQTQDKKYMDIARISEEKLDKCFEDYYGLHHDTGFMWLPTAVADYRRTGKLESRKRALHAAQLLAGRYNPVGKFIRAWNDLEESTSETGTKGWAIIDCMLNIPLLYWASDETKDPRFKQIAMLHADTVMETFIRPDGSVNHIVEFDPYNGGVVKTYGGQGYEDGSSWTRGQSWAIYGFVMSYVHTGKQAYLDTAKRVAHYFMANIPENGLIPVDFRQPKEPHWEDTIAASVTACGLLEMIKHVPELEKSMYESAALKMMKALVDQRCNWDNQNDGIVQYGTGAYHSEVKHENFTYGDYYFMEAIFRLKGRDVLKI